MDEVSTWQANYKSMTAEQLSAEYQKLLISNKRDPAKADKLNFLKQEFSIRIKQ